MTYGLKLIDGRLVLGAQSTRGGFVPQVSELQPVGHWVDAEGGLRAQFWPGPGLITRFFARRRDYVYVHYPKERRVPPIIE